MSNQEDARKILVARLKKAYMMGYGISGGKMKMTRSTRRTKTMVGKGGTGGKMKKKPGRKRKVTKQPKKRQAKGGVLIDEFGGVLIDSACGNGMKRKRRPRAKKGGRSNPWITKVKRYAAQNRVSYKQALQDLKGTQ